jgi:hypothetical protein
MEMYSKYVKKNFIFLLLLLFKDGGLIANNPTSIALHECKLLWPGEDIQCVVSLGNGRPSPDVALQSKSMTCKSKKSLRIKIRILFFSKTKIIIISR